MLKSKKMLMAGFIALFVIATIGLIWVQSKISKSVKMAGRSVAKLPNPYEYSWLTNDKLLIQAQEYVYSEHKKNLPFRFQVVNIHGGSFDQLTALNYWISNRESGAGVLLNHYPNTFSPDGKWLFCTEMKTLSVLSWMSTNQNWLLSLDGTKQISIKGQYQPVKWLPDSSGIIVSQYLNNTMGNGAKNSKPEYSHSVLTLNNLKKTIPIPGVFYYQDVETASTYVGAQIVDLIADYFPVQKQLEAKIESLHVEKRNKESYTVESKGAKIPFPKHGEKYHLDSCLLSPIGNRLLWTFQENSRIANSNMLAEMFRRPNAPEFVITDLDGKPVYELPHLERPSEVRWLPDGKHLSYTSGETIYVMDLN